MPDMSKLVSRVLLLALFLTPFQEHPAAADSVLKVRFEFAKVRNSILISARINGKPVLLIFDTGSARTALCPEVVGLSRDALASEGANREVTLQVGNRKWDNRSVADMNLSQAQSVCQEGINGILGLDFLKEFSLVTINTEYQTLTLTEQDATGQRHDPVLIQGARADKPSFGNLRKLALERGSGQYVLNGTKLSRISADAICLNTADLSHTICITFLETVLLSKGEPIDRSKKDLVSKWSEQIPLVGKILKQQDPIASLKPLGYALIAPKDGKGLHLRELLWSANPADRNKIGDTGFGPLIQLSEPMVDIQYRGLIAPSDHLIAKIMLQILYIQDGAD